MSKRKGFFLSHESKNKITSFAGKNISYLCRNTIELAIYDNVEKCKDVLRSINSDYLNTQTSFVLRHYLRTINNDKYNIEEIDFDKLLDCICSTVTIQFAIHHNSFEIVVNIYC